MRLPSFLVATFLLPAAALAQQMPGSIYFQPPGQSVLSVVSEQEWRLYHQFFSAKYRQETYEFDDFVSETRTVTEEVDGVAKERLVQVQIPVTKTAVRSIFDGFDVEWDSETLSPETVLAFETDGEPLKPEEVAKRCSGNTLVVVSSTKGMIASQYAKLFRKGTIILAPTSEFGDVPAPAVLDAPESSADDDLPTTLFPTIVVARAYGPSVEIRDYQEFRERAPLRSYDEGDSPIVTIAERVYRQTVSTSVPASVLRLSRAGADVPIDQLGSTGQIVLMSTDGRPVDDFWLQNLAPSTLVLRGTALIDAEPEAAAPVSDGGFEEFPAPPAPEAPAPAPEPAPPAEPAPAPPDDVAAPE